MKYPKPFWKGRLDDSTWIGLLNWYVLRHLWLRLAFNVSDDHDIVVSIELLFCHPRYMYPGNVNWSKQAKVLLRWKV